MLIVRPLPVAAAVIIVVAAAAAAVVATAADSCIIKCLGQSFDARPCQWVFGQRRTFRLAVVAVPNVRDYLLLLSGHTTK